MIKMQTMVIINSISFLHFNLDVFNCLLSSDNIVICTVQVQVSAVFKQDAEKRFEKRQNKIFLI
jgi:hypothetical protein